MDNLKKKIMDILENHEVRYAFQYHAEFAIPSYEFDDLVDELIELISNNKVE